MAKRYGVIVAGGGHAGCEAALAAARMGVPTLLVSLDPDKIAVMSCNPSIGGVGKGQLVKEVDALGGEMGRNADYTAIHFKRLNTRKGSAVRSSRCQSDKNLYAKRMQGVLSGQPNLEVARGELKRLRVENGRVVGAILATPGGEETLEARSVVITAGTFMRGVLHCGETTSPGGRIGEDASVGLSDFLATEGFRVLRLKTGTPARLFRDSIDWTQLAEQVPDEVPLKFSFFESEIELPQVSCFLGYTNPQTHDVIRQNLHRSPLYSGRIQGVGPRYCPSIEDKVVKFPDKDRHQVFFEPEALDSDWIYPNGISTSLPQDVQEAFLKTLPGCQNVRFARFGYAVEYDCLDPRDLKHTFESKLLAGLFLAGQVNGTSGYEEAAAQGLLAGINAALLYKEADPFLLSRAESYLGVLVDDLTTHGVNEPYRMFTSRAEYRLSLREDNADLRLSRRGFEVGLLPESDYRQVESRRANLIQVRQYLNKTILKPEPSLQAKLAGWGTAPMAAAQPLNQLLKRPELGLLEIRELAGHPDSLSLPPESIETLEVEVKYEGYIAMQAEEIVRLSKMQLAHLPESLDYGKVAGLSYELREKLTRSRPQTIADASRIPGVTPAALSALLYHVDRRADARPH